MTDYDKLVKALRCCCPQPEETCDGCPYDTAGECNISRMMFDAAAAIEALETEIRESMQKCAECGDEQEQKVKELQARLGEAENSAERWKDMYLTKQLPKRGEWVKGSDGLYHCSECGKTAPYLDAFDGVIQYWEPLFFCNNCGADMRAKMEVQDA